MYVVVLFFDGSSYVSVRIELRVYALTLSSFSLSSPQTMIDSRNTPIYVHCLDGARVTGLVVLCLRKLQNWKMRAAVQEFGKYTKGLEDSEQSFVDSFLGPIKLPREIPRWLRFSSNDGDGHPQNIRLVRLALSLGRDGSSSKEEGSRTPPERRRQRDTSTDPPDIGGGQRRGGLGESPKQSEREVEALCIEGFY